MKVVVMLEHRFDQTPDGAIWTQTMFAYRFWKRYLEVFDHVRVVARVRPVEAVPCSWERADGDGVSVVAVPHYLGPGQFLRQLRQVQRATRAAVGHDDAVILRVSSTIANVLVPHLRRTNRPYGVEVVCDPYDGFAPGAISHPLRPLFRWWFSQQLRRQCANAHAASYVTKQALQDRYPPTPGRFAIPCSDVELPASALAPRPREVLHGTRRIHLVTVGSLAHRHKGLDILIDAVHICVRSGHDLQLNVVGDGMYRPELEAQARRLGIAGRVEFRGQLTAGAPVRIQLDAADLFILASRQEGLPRAMVEAMARALPCIGTAIGGIPELLPSADLVPSGDAAALAREIQDVVSDPARMARMSARNLETAKHYQEDVQRRSRLAFHQEVRRATEVWRQAAFSSCTSPSVGNHSYDDPVVVES